MDYRLTFNYNKQLLKMSDNENNLIQQCIDEIWQEYDKDKNGYLDKEECKKFILSTVDEMKGTPMPQGELDFDNCFDEIDTDDSGNISKAEMINLFKKVAQI